MYTFKYFKIQYKHVKYFYTNFFYKINNLNK